MKPALTQEQKDKFEKKFREILDRTPKEIKESWSGQIYWSPADTPIIDGNIQSKLKGKLAGDFVVLINRVNDRII